MTATNHGMFCKLVIPYNLRKNIQLDYLILVFFRRNIKAVQRRFTYYVICLQQYARHIIRSYCIIYVRAKPITRISIYCPLLGFLM
jgi:hypothetical protein